MTTSCVAPEMPDYVIDVSYVVNPEVKELE
jgi:hypothetical protein